MTKISSDLNGVYWAENKSLSYIVRFKNGMSQECIKVMDRGVMIASFHTSSSFGSHHDYDYSPATPEHQHWLKECAKAGRAIPIEECNYRPPVIEYQIY